jgi:hypothetical protein
MSSRSTLKRLALLGAVATTLGIAAPVASASAAGAPAAPAKLAAFPFDGFAPGAFGFEGPVFNGQALGGAVSGAVIITTAPTSFINTNNQISPVGNFTAGQVAVP